MRDFSPPSSPPASRVRQSFCRGLSSYHQSASVQADIARNLADMVVTHRGAQAVGRCLEFGCGTGHLTRALVDRLSIADLALNDLVGDCEPHVMARLPAGQRARFQAGPVERLDPEGTFDLIASASVVQWIPDHRCLLRDLSNRLESGGWIALSGFGQDQFGELQALGSSASAPGYRNAGDWAAMIPQGMALMATRQIQTRMYFPTVRAVLRHLRETGVNGNAQGGWSRARLQKFERDYDAQFGTAQGLPLTYDAVWMLACKI
ncbi:methyltransferase domain-containing protein [Rhodobacteraceae bacterium M382]|nr:methyltransferase domain-containing protein [Rhodobacteraceae bacterium M382]